MQTRHPLRATLVATMAPLLAIVVFGNSWFTENVRIDGDHGPLALRLYATLAPFTWTFTPRNGPGAGTIWAAQIVGIVAVLGGTFLIIWAVSRHATGSSLLLGAWAATIPMAMLGAFVTTFLSYGAFYGDANIDGTGRFWFSVFESQNVALWGVWVGLFVGVLASVTAGGVDTRPDYVTSSLIPGSEPIPQPEAAAPPVPEPALVGPSLWAQQTYVAAPVYTAAPPDVQPPPPQPPAAGPSQPVRPHGDPTVVMVQPGTIEPPPPSPSPPTSA